LAQLIGVITLPIITRIYTPSEMGILTIYSSILSIAVIAATFRYEFTYILPEKEEKAANIFALCIMILSITSVAFSLIIILAGDVLVDFLGLGSLGNYYWLLIPGFVGAGFYSVLNYWAIRHRDYHRITYTRLNQSFGGAISKIILGLLSFGSIGLIFGHIISQVAGIGTLSKAMWRTEKRNLGKVSISGIKSAAREYWTFPAFNLPSSILNTLSLQLPPLLLVAIYDPHIVGLYALAYGILVIPSSIVSSSLGQAFMGEVSKIVRERSPGLRQVYLKTVRDLALIAIPSIGIIALTAPFLISLIFGNEWADAGLLCIPLAIMIIPQFIISPTTHLTIYGFNHWMLMWDIARVSGVVVSFYISHYFGVSVLITLLLYSSVMLIMYVILVPLNLLAISKLTTGKNHNLPNSDR
jgi:O-antigen/teichoic acid export membrane protein